MWQHGIGCLGIPSEKKGVDPHMLAPCLVSLPSSVLLTPQHAPPSCILSQIVEQ
jgi:hypothetical protein